jgi:Mannosyltransferase (PIG-V)
MARNPRQESLVETATPASLGKSGLLATSAASKQRDVPHLLDRTAWRDAAIVWLLQRAVFLGLTFCGQALLSVAPPSWATIYRPWVSWDAIWYARIAQRGYTEPLDAAFSPLYPLTEHILAPLAAGHAVVAGLLIANAACLAAFAALRVLVERELDQAAAQRALVYLACFPMSFFLAAAYTESLFLLLSLGTFLALRRHCWLTAGLLGALATLTRPVGILLLLPLATEAVRSLRARSATSGLGLQELAHLVAGLALPVAALAGFWAYLASIYGTPFATARAQQYHLWARHLSWPWEGLVSVGWALLHPRHDMALANASLDLFFTLVFIVLALAMIGRLPVPYVAYAWAMLLAVSVTPIHTVNWAALSSNPRFLLVVFPVFMLLASFSRRWVQRLIVVTSLSLLVVLILVFANGAFLA